MSRLYNIVEYKGEKINIYFDDYPDDPRDEYDHCTTIYSNIAGYSPDGKSIDNFLTKLELENFPGSFINLCEIAYEKGYYAMPIYAYIHGGIDLSLKREGQFADRFDSGVFGVIAISKQDIYREFSCKRISKNVKDKLYKYFEEEIKEYVSYTNGECYLYKVFEDTEDEERMTGFVGDSGLSSLMQYAKQSIDCVLEEREKAAVEFWNDIDEDVA